MSTGFSHRQLKKLATPLDRAKVHTREVGGKTLSYVEGWFVIAEANRIFGYDGWDRVMVHFERVFERKVFDGVSCGYAARVKVSVRANGLVVAREGTGFGQATATLLGDAHERALKAAETDATKRALATFGSRFGLSLYDKDQQPGQGNGFYANGNGAAQPQPGQSAGPTAVETASTPQGYQLAASDGSTSEVQSAEGFCAGLRQFLEATQTVDEVLRLQGHNAGVLATLRDLPNLKTQRGDHYADILERLFAKRIDALMPATAPEAGPEDSNTAAEGTAPDDQDRGQKRGGYGSYVPVPPYPLADTLDRLAGNAPGSDEVAPKIVEAVSEAPPQTFITPPPEAPPPQPVRPTRRSKINGGVSIDKSVFAVPSERRLRSKAHLAFVAGKPCLICEELPCHAHHITFAQARGMSLKVSDEFTVPLCVVHHNALHASGNEASWWRAQRIEPLAHAQELWLASTGASQTQPIPEKESHEN